MDEILTVKEVADYLKLSRTTVWRWCNDGKLNAFKVGRGWRIHRSVLERLVGQGSQPERPEEKPEREKAGTSLASLMLEHA